MSSAAELRCETGQEAHAGGAGRGAERGEASTEDMAHTSWNKYPELPMIPEG